MTSKTTIAITATLLLLFGADAMASNDGLDFGKAAQNAAEGGLGIWYFLKMAFMVAGYGAAGVGVWFAFISTDQQPMVKKGAAWKMMIGGGLMASVMTIIVMTQNQVGIPEGQTQNSLLNSSSN